MVVSDSQVIKGAMDYRVVLDLQDLQDQRDSKGSKDLLEQTACLDQQGHKEILVALASKAKVVSKDYRVHQETRATQDLKDPTVQLDHQDQKVIKVQLEWQARKDQ